jgi:hypothetical protein
VHLLVVTLPLIIISNIIISAALRIVAPGGIEQLHYNMSQVPFNGNVHWIPTMLQTSRSEFVLIEAIGTQHKRDHVLCCFRDTNATGTIIYFPVRYCNLMLEAYPHSVSLCSIA